MTATLHLVRIEFKRNAALWLVPVMLGLIWLVSQGSGMPDELVLWSNVSAQIGASLIIVGPLIGGVAAWMATRDRRRRIEELLATTSRPPLARDLSGWTAVAAWGLLAYALVGVYHAAEGAREATWGGPEAAPILVGLVAVVACAALGYAAGVYVPSRFTAALLPIVLFIAAIYGADADSSLRHLSPFTLVDPAGHSTAVYGVYQELKAGFGPLHMAWLAGLGGCALAAVALRRKRSGPAWSTLIAAVALAALSATLLLRIDPDRLYGATTPAEPTCVQRAIPVCLHPAYATLLDEEAELVDRLARPLAGLPGAPTRAEQLPFGTRPVPHDVLVLFSTHTTIARGEQLTEDFLDLEVDTIVWQLVSAPSEGSEVGAATEAQAALALWLVRQAGDLPATSGTSAAGSSAVGSAAAMERRINAAAERFAALDPGQQRAWLAANYSALRAGELALDEMP
jgi:hypothetical protein